MTVAIFTIVTIAFIRCHNLTYIRTSISRC